MLCSLSCGHHQEHTSFTSWEHGGQTLAMRAWKLKLVSPYGRRWFYLASIFISNYRSYSFFVSFLWVIFNKKNQYLHDFILGLEIIDVRF